MSLQRKRGIFLVGNFIKYVSHEHQQAVYHAVCELVRNQRTAVSVTSCHFRLSRALAHQGNKTKLMLLEHVKWMCSANPGLRNSLCLNLTRL